MLPAYGARMACRVASSNLEGITSGGALILAQTYLTAWHGFAMAWRTPRQSSHSEAELERSRPLWHLPQVAHLELEASCNETEQARAELKLQCL